mmetsp:Transcript_65629/g.168945  ORF Transcript_65629/g.168945 Transcript_65629/m.168945 type:complete len:495 (-) Transcript_65629:88-1572(-)
MVRDVKALDLILRRHAQDTCELHGVEEDAAGHEAPSAPEEAGEQLVAKLLAAATVEEAVEVRARVALAVLPALATIRRLDVLRHGEEAHSQQPDHARAEVQAGCAQGVVDLELQLQRAEPEEGQRAQGRDDEEHGPDGDDGAARADGDHACQDAVHGVLDRGVLVHRHAEQERRDAARATSERGDGGDTGGLASHGAGDGEAGACVEGDEAEPEDEDAEGHHAHVAGRDLHRLAALVEAPEARTQGHCGHQGRDARERVDSAAASIVNDGHLVEEAVGTPDPVRGDGVDDAGQHDAVDHVRPELDALGHRPRHDGGDGGCEDVLEEPGEVVLLAGWCQGKVAPADELVARAIASPAICETVAKQVVDHASDHSVHEVLEHDALGVLGANGARLEQAEARLQEEADEASNQDPGGVDGGVELRAHGLEHLIEGGRVLKAPRLLLRLKLLDALLALCQGRLQRGLVDLELVLVVCKLTHEDAHVRHIGHVHGGGHA